MIVCLDGPYGVGKSSVAVALKDKVSSRMPTELLDADDYYQCWMMETPEKYFFGGLLPQNNKCFVSRYCNLIKEKAAEKNKLIISAMSLCEDVSAQGILSNLRENHYDVIHLILVATCDTLKKRIENDSNRDKGYSLQWIPSQLLYFETKMKDEKRVDTEGKSIDKITDEIISIIQERI